MKGALLLFSTFLFTISTAFGQCSPDTQYADEDFGVWPDTTQGFPDAQVGVYYEQVVTIKIPDNGGPIDSLYESFQIDSASLSNIVNIPPGLELVCNSQTSGECSYLPEQLGCAIVQGTPTEAGDYDIIINTTIYSVLFGSVVPFPRAFEGYNIKVDESSGLANASDNEFMLQPNYPNPAETNTTLYYWLSSPVHVTIEVYDLVGKEIMTDVVQGKQGKNSYFLDVSNLESGVYLYSVIANGHKQTRRLAVDR